MCFLRKLFYNLTDVPDFRNINNQYQSLELQTTVWKFYDSVFKNASHNNKLDIFRNVFVIEYKP